MAGYLCSCPTAPIAQPSAVGADEKGDTPRDKAKAEQALKSMKRSLRGWLKVRKTMDDYVAGKREAPRLFRHPGAKPLPPAAIAATLRQERFADEQDLAQTLFVLLSEVGLDPACLPEPDVAKDPEVAAKLAKIAIAGKCSSEVTTAQSTGIVWFVLAIPVAGIVLVISQVIKSRAEVAKEKERLRCIQSGACTDAGFWLKVASVAVLGWVAWDKLGIREVAKDAFKRKKK